LETTISVISTCASGLQLKKEYNILNDDIFYEDTDNIIKASENLSNTIEVFSEFVKSDNKIEAFFINSFIGELNQILKKDLDQNNIDLIINIKNNPIEITTVKNDLLTVISHLIYNAKDILIDREIDNPKIKLEISKDGDTIVFLIEDNGGGIKSEIIGKIFDPYFTTKHQSFNTGLGLYKSHMIITKLLKSDIDVVNTNLGAKFTINLKNLT
jgi:signal transduction histidine kinase